MKLSEAILLGIGAVEERRNVFLLVHPHPCGCALGTAFYAAGKADEYKQLPIAMDSAIRFCQSLWPWTARPVEPGSPITVAGRISSRHFHGESRESIAAWIATIEPQDEPATVQATDAISTEVA